MDEAVLVAIGVDSSGRRQILGVSVAISEAEAHWRTFLKSLQERGLTGVTLIISDDHAGLREARQALFPSVPWQRCQFHLQQNAAAYVTRQDLRKQVASDIRAIFNAPERAEAERLLKLAVHKYAQCQPKLADWMEKNLPEGFTVFNFPPEHRRRLRTTNVLERTNREIRRRTRVATLFPNEASCLRLVSAVLMEISEDWQTDKVYLKMS
jgi:transposase-like protein